MNILLSLLVLASQYTVSAVNASTTTVTGTLSQTTTAFTTPPTVTSTFQVTYTPPVSVTMVTVTGAPETSIVVGVTVANINIGLSKSIKMPRFIQTTTYSYQM